MPTLDLIFASIAVLLLFAEIGLMLAVLAPRFSLRAVLLMTTIALFLGAIMATRNFLVTH
jgi:hypothetical protein